MAGMRTQIFQALEAQLIAGLPWAKTVAWDRIRLLASDFADHEIPVVQFYGVRTDYSHQHGKLEARLQLAVEIVLRQTATSVVSQETLVDYMETVEQVIGARPNLGVPGVVHLRYLSDEIDLHMIEPFYYGRLSFEAIFHKPYTGIC